MSSPRESKAEEGLTLLDWLGATVASLGTMFCCLFALFVGPRLQKVLADFGGELTALTRLMLMPWVPLLLGLIPAFMVALALVGKTSRGVRRGLIVGASFLSLLAIGLCLYTRYSPLFDFAEFIIEEAANRSVPPGRLHRCVASLLASASGESLPRGVAEDEERVPPSAFSSSPGTVL